MDGLRQRLTPSQQYRERKERKAEPHLGSRKNKTTNQVSSNLKFFPSWSFQEQMHTHRTKSSYFGLLFLSQVPLWEVGFPWLTIRQSYKSVPPSISEKGGVQARSPKQAFHLLPQLRRKVGALTRSKPSNFSLAAYRTAEIWFQIKASQESKGWGMGLSYRVG